MSKEILLVNSGADEGYKNFMSVPPLGLISLYSALPNEAKKETILLDGNLESLDEIQEVIRREKPKIVGISSLTFGYENAIKIAENSKAQGAYVVLGGVHVTSCYRQISERMKRDQRPFDRLVRGRGEQEFSRIVESKTRTGIMEVSEEFPILDYSILKKDLFLEKYAKRIGRVGMFSKANLTVPIVSQIGCAQKGKNHCKFCSIPREYFQTSPEIFEASLRNLINQTRADTIWIIDADLGTDYEHLQKISKVSIKVREDLGSNHAYYCFVRADNLNDAVGDELSKFGVKGVFIGYEHGNDELLELMGKGTTRAQNLKATRILAERGIEVTCGGIVLGTPGETRKTLEESIMFVDELSRIGNVKSIFAGPVYLLPGSPYWREFMDALKSEEPLAYNTLKDQDIFSEEHLVSKFRKLAYLMPFGARREDSPKLEEVLQAKDQISEILGGGIQFTEDL